MNFLCDKAEVASVEMLDLLVAGFQTVLKHSPAVRLYLTMSAAMGDRRKPIPRQHSSKPVTGQSRELLHFGSRYTVLIRISQDRPSERVLALFLKSDSSRK